MSRNYKFHNPEGLYFVTFTVVRWIDVFTRQEYKDIMVDSLKYWMENKGLELYAGVTMSNHAHLIIGTKGKPIGGIVWDIKRHTSKAVTKAIGENMQESRRDWMLWFFEREGKRNPNNENHQFWPQDESHPIELWSSEVMDQKLDYIHNNPVVAGWVDKPEHYLYCSARDYAGDKGLIDIILLI